MGSKKPDLVRYARMRDFLASFLGSKHPTSYLLLLALAIILISQWLPEIINGILECLLGGFRTLKLGPLNFSLVFGLKALVVLFILLYFLILMKNIRRISSRLQVIVDDNPPPVKSLLVFLSPIGPSAVAALRRKEIDDLDSLKKNNKSLYMNKLSTFKKDFTASWSWAMPFRAIKHHYSRLEKLYVVSSLQSHGDFTYFVKLVDLLFPGRTFSIAEWPKGTQGIDFQEIDKIFQVVNDFYEEMKTKKVKSSDTLVDITGGMVPTSVGAALATLIKGRVAEYVVTSTKEVIAYDVTYVED